MDAYALIVDFRNRGIVLIPDGEKLMAEPASRLSDADRAAIRQSKPDLLRILSKIREASPLGKADATRWRQGLAPNSRNPLTPPAIRAIIEAIEAEARFLGWPPELLWNAEFWDSPRGLAAVIDEGDEIAEVTTDYIAILKVERSILRFQRRIS